MVIATHLAAPLAAFWVSLSLLAAGLASPTALASEPLASPGQSQAPPPIALVNVRVLIGEPLVPFEFKNGGELVGFDVDIWKAIARTAELAYTFQVMPFEEIMPALAAGRGDIGLAGFLILPDRQKLVDFSDPYYVNGVSILIGAQAHDVLSAEDLSKKWVGVKAGSTSARYLRRNTSSIKFKVFPNIDAAYLALATQGIDAVVHDAYSVQYYARAHSNGRSRVAAALTRDEPVGVAFAKGSDLGPVINRALAGIKSSGEYDSIYSKWFGQVPPLLNP